LKKLVLLGAIVAMVIVAAAPAVAQISQGESERRITSGPSAPKTEVKNSGNNVNLCTNLLQAAQSGNVANEQGVSQYNDKTDDIGFSGSTVELTPAATSECTQTIEQAAAAGPKAEAKAGKAAPKAEAKAGKAEAKAEAKELPKTGGVAGTASLLGLGAGALLVAGGLLARRMFR
jgi:LPXTG-motif cell wall-anchored protein